MPVYTDKSHEELRWEEYQLAAKGGLTTSSALGEQRGGSRVTPETDGGAIVTQPTQPEATNIESISALQVYKDISHEEHRWEDYQSGDKGAQGRLFDLIRSINVKSCCKIASQVVELSIFAQNSHSQRNSSKINLEVSVKIEDGDCPIYLVYICHFRMNLTDIFTHLIA